MKIEAEEKPEELKMADGTVVKTEGRVQLKLKCVDTEEVSLPGFFLI